MPVLAIIPAIVAVSSVGVAGFGAVLAGTAALGTTFAAIGAVGATLGAIGEIAGVKELKTAGLVLGGIGGVGALASAVGAFGEGATLNTVFGSATPVTSTAGAATTAAGGTGMINGGAGFMDAEGGQMLDFATGVPTDSADAFSSMDIVSAANKIGGQMGGDIMEGPSGSTDLAGASSDARKQILTDTGSASQAKQVGATDSAVESATVTATKPSGSSVTGNIKAPPTNPVLGQNFTNDDSGASYQWDGKQWVSKPSFWGNNTGAMVGMGVLQAAGSFLSGATDELKPAQAAAYNAQAAANNAQAALTNREVSNMNSNIPVARRLNVTGNTGMINR